MSAIGADRHAAIANLQIIHNVPDAGPLDVYLDGARLHDDFDYRTATPFEVILGGTYTFDFVAGMDEDNANPIFTADLTFTGDLAYVIVAHGLVNPAADQPAFDLAVLEDAQVVAGEGEVEIAIVHGAPGLGVVDVRLLDPVDNMNTFGLLANNIGFGDAVLYQTLAATGQNIELTSPDNEVQVEVFRIELQASRGEALVLILSGTGATHAEDLEALYVTSDGEVNLAPVITANAEELAPPVAFALHGAYPNPFNPSTAIRIDVPAAADVRIDLYDLHGRRVLTTTRALAAGVGRVAPLEAGHLASGVYLYRVFAHTSAKTYTGTGRLVLVR